MTERESEKERERERSQVEKEQRERETQNPMQAPGSVSTEPDAGLEPMNHEIMT